MPLIQDISSCTVDIDQNRRYLRQLLNEACEGVVLGFNVEEYLLEELSELLTHCFSCEEALMLESSYPNLSEHKAEHDLINNKVASLQNNIKQDPNAHLNMLMFLSNWIIHHIDEADSKLARFVKERNSGRI